MFHNDRSLLHCSCPWVHMTMAGWGGVKASPWQLQCIDCWTAGSGTGQVFRASTNRRMWPLTPAVSQLAAHISLSAYSPPLSAATHTHTHWVLYVFVMQYFHVVVFLKVFQSSSCEVTFIRFFCPTHETSAGNRATGCLFIVMVSVFSQENKH